MRNFPPRRILWGGHGACPELNDEILHFVQNDMRGAQNDNLPNALTVFYLANNFLETKWRMRYCMRPLCQSKLAFSITG